MNGNQSSLRAILRSWIEGVNEGRLGEVGALYAESAVLIPTFSPSIYNSESEIAGYFHRITDQRSVSVTVREETVVEQLGQDGSHIIGGIYDWQIIKEGEESVFGARFTFVIAPGQSRPILHHHSSLLPEVA
ncbi:MAG TPA: hypothetical protein DD438_09845 [Verrucomicrobiales bacterium]|mgnify:CR=1 FL=1|nr:hypothetical protein [Verrucomicrobiales bacterium]HCQ37737.1 hypothetical protein [Verrucomicrobiales bacterium]|tara:strand:- start:6460 stop:6855 length:396 start_codon:yes stop_codon:yes gene_type:complete